MEGPEILASLAAAVASALLTFGVWRAALGRRILIDTPNPRSSHDRPRPRGGGAGVLGGLAVGLALAFGAHSFDRATLFLLLGALVCAAIGLLDDLRGLSVAPRLAAQFAAAGLLILETGPLLSVPLPAPLDPSLGAAAFLFPVVWLVGVVNFFNFMDGLDGLATGQAIATCLLAVAAAWSPDASFLALLLLGALLGFLPFNWWPSRIFLGDVGSLPVGFLLGGLPLLAPAPDRSRAVLATAISLTLFLLDPVVTLWRRWRRGARLGQSHREHIYQGFLAQGDPHRGVTSAMVLAGLGLSAAGLLAYRRPSLGWAAVLVAASAFGAELRLSMRRTPR